MAKITSLGQIDNKSLRERVLDSLRTAIINGELKPGDTLIETDLAAQLGISRAPLREAINILSVEGLVETIPYHGTKVRKLARKDIEELYSVRSMMEVFAIERIIAAGPDRVDEAVTALRRICDEMMGAAREGSMTDVNSIDRRFHNALIEHSGNNLLFMLWNSVTLRVQQVMSLRNKKTGDLQQIARNHLTIVDAIARLDTAEAIRLICEHIGISADLIAEGWEEVDGGQPTGD